MLSCDIHGKISTYKCSLALTYFFYFVILLNWPSWPWSYGSWIYNYPCNQCLSPLSLMLWVWISIRAKCTALCDKVCQWLATGQWFSPGTPVSSTNTTDRHDIVESGVKHHQVIKQHTSSCHSFNLSEIHLKDLIGNKRKNFHMSSLEGYQLISAF